MIYEVGIRTCYNKCELGCTADETIANITTWGGNPIETGSILEVYDISRTKLQQIYRRVGDKWTLMFDLNT